MRGSQLYATDARRTTREIPPLVRSRSLALSLSLTPSLAKKKLFFCSEELPPPQGAPSRALPGDLNPPCYLYVSFFSRIFSADASDFYLFHFHFLSSALSVSSILPLLLWCALKAEAQLFLLGKTTRLVSPREGTSRVVFSNKRTTSCVLLLRWS